jgi:hypothetical protein
MLTTMSEFEDPRIIAGRLRHVVDGEPVTQVIEALLFFLADTLAKISPANRRKACAETIAIIAGIYR